MSSHFWPGPAPHVGQRTACTCLRLGFLVFTVVYDAKTRSKKNVENPKRFTKSRDVGPYLGLVPKQEDSGESQPQLGISKAGDGLTTIWVAALRAWWEECEEESGGCGGAEAGRLTTPAVGEWRGVRAAAQRDVGTDRGGSLAGQGGRGKRDRKREDNRHAICCGGQDQS